MLRRHRRPGGGQARAPRLPSPQDELDFPVWAASPSLCSPYAGGGGWSWLSPLPAAGAPGRGEGFWSTPISAGSKGILQHLPPPPAPAAKQGDAKATLLQGRGKKYPEGCFSP